MKYPVPATPPERFCDEDFVAATLQKSPPVLFNGGDFLFSAERARQAMRIRLPSDADSPVKRCRSACQAIRIRISSDANLLIK
jgi:hypothetical protein